MGAKSASGSAQACAPTQDTEAAIEAAYGMSFRGVLRTLYEVRHLTLQQIVSDLERHGIHANKSTVGRWLHNEEIPLRARGNPYGRRSWPSYRRTLTRAS